jgi:Na+-transporting NADH:ubiquinone oxidoreductase subunit B
MMITVVVALIPCTLFGIWNTGYQANLAISRMEQMGSPAKLDWHHAVQVAAGLGHNPESFADNFVYGLVFFLPIYVVCMFVGGHLELAFSMIRGHEINEGFLVTGLLFPLTLPPNIPLWQVALGIAFGVVVGKEIFGGTGRNFLNPALTARAFLYFAYPGEIIGVNCWTAVDGFSGATPLGVMAVADPTKGVVENLAQVATTTGTTAFTWWDCFLGIIPGSIGETSALCALIGAFILILSGVGSWRIMLGVIAGAAATAALLNAVGSPKVASFQLTPAWHLVIGSLAFGAVFMATDPVSAAMTEKGRWFYGGLIGFMTVLIRVINPAYPEGVMLAILFGNLFAPLIDYMFVSANIRRRARYVQVRS